jgi:hypothetical protein
MGKKTMNYSGLSVHIDPAIIGHSGFFGHFKMCSTPLYPILPRRQNKGAKNLGVHRMVENSKFQ